MGFFDWLSGGPSRVPEIRISKRAANALTFGEWKISRGVLTTLVTYHGGKGLPNRSTLVSVYYDAYDADDVKLAMTSGKYTRMPDLNRDGRVRNRLRHHIRQGEPRCLHRHLHLIAFDTRNLPISPRSSPDGSMTP